MKKLLCENNGGALLITLGIMLMISVAAIMAVHTAQTDIDLSFNQLHYDQAFYVADAGIKRTLFKLNEDNLWNGAYSNVTFEEGAYSVAVIHRHLDSAIIDTVDVRSTGAVQEARANLRAIIVPELFFPFNWAMFGDDHILMDNSSNTDSYNSDSGTYVATADSAEGDVASNGTVTLDNTATVGGDASSALVGGVTVCATCTVHETVNNEVEPFELEPIPADEFTYYSTNNDNASISSLYLTGYDLSLSTLDTVELASGVYYFDNISLSSNSSIKVAPGASVKIYLRGTLTLDNNTSINPTEDPADCIILSDGQVVTIGADTEIYAAFYGPDADVDLGNSCDWYGSLIAESVDVLNTGFLHYDQALGQVPTTTTGSMVMIAWEEQ